MKFSLNFIREFLPDLEISPQKLATSLTRVGLEIEEIEQKENDTVFTAEVTSNRYDWLSIFGISYELAAAVNKKIKLSFPYLKIKTYRKRKVIIENKEDCPFYTGHSLVSVRVDKSPPWLRELLLNCGINSVNNVVDITNYCLLKWGQPLHSFDEDKLQGDIYIRRARNKEKFLGLDGKERLLNSDNLVIADEKKVIAVAGVMGSKETEVDENTRNVFLEAALFSPLLIRVSRRKLNLNTASSYRFERGINPRCIQYSWAEAVRLICSLAGAEYKGSIKTGNPPSCRRRTIFFSPRDLNNYLGYKIPLSEAKNILKNLGFSISTGGRGSTLKKEKTLRVCPPVFRRDIKEKVDIYEEISRIYGYEKIPPSFSFLNQLSCSWQSGTSEKNLYHFKNNLREVLAMLGLKEVVTYSIEEEALAEVFPHQEFLKLVNPLKKGENILRKSLFLGMFKVINTAVARPLFYQPRLHFFEIADTYHKENESFCEKPCLGIILWEEKKENGLILKSILKEIFSFLNIRESYQQKELPGFKNALEIYSQNKRLGFLAQLEAEIKNKLSLKLASAPAIKKGDIFFSELDLQVLFSLSRESIFKAFSLTPYIYRDISFTVKKDKKFKVFEKILASKPSYIKDWQIVDFYKGEDLPADCNSFTLRVYYSSDERTLTAEEVDRINEEVRLSFLKEGAILR